MKFNWSIVFESVLNSECNGQCQAEISNFPTTEKLLNVAQRRYVQYFLDVLMLNGIVPNIEAMELKSVTIVCPSVALTKRAI